MYLMPSLDILGLSMRAKIALKFHVLYFEEVEMLSSVPLKTTLQEGSREKKTLEYEKCQGSF